MRFLIGDTVSAAQLVQDEEINAILGYQPSPAYAAAAICDSLGARFSVQVDKSIGDTSVSSSQRARAFAALADRLRAGGPGLLPGGDGTGERSADMFVGGLSIAGNTDLFSDTGNVQPAVRVGQDDIPGTPSNNQPTTNGFWD